MVLLWFLIIISIVVSLNPQASGVEFREVLIHKVSLWGMVFEDRESK